jgi:hypothetical protein
MTVSRLLLCMACSLAAAVAIATEPAAAPDYAWPDITDFLKQLVGRVGAPVKVYRLVIDRDGKVDLWIQDQRHRDLVDSYEYERGTVSGPIPVKFEHYPSIEALDRHVIELTTIDFQRLPSMLAAAKAKLGMPDARLVRIELERGDSHGFLTYSDIPIWTFDLDSPRHDGRVELSLEGRVLDADKD